jgi:hypothetical protein
MQLSESTALKAPGMKVHLECFIVKLAGETTFHYAGHTIDITDDGRNPDEIVLEMLTAETGLPNVCKEHCFIHSTSWRYDNGNTIVLTYLIYSDRVVFHEGTVNMVSLNAVTIPTSDDPVRPRPAQIYEEQVVVHGIRHISHIVKLEGQNVMRVLEPHSIHLFKAIDSVLAGKFCCQDHNHP